MITLAACQYHIDLLETWDAYAAHLTSLCQQAAEQGAQLLLLPEYAGLVLSGQLPAAEREQCRQQGQREHPQRPARRKAVAARDSFSKQHGAPSLYLSPT